MKRWEEINLRLCEEVIEAAKKVVELGGGHYRFTKIYPTEYPYEKYTENGKVKYRRKDGKSLRTQTKETED